MLSCNNMTSYSMKMLQTFVFDYTYTYTYIYLVNMHNHAVCNIEVKIEGDTFIDKKCSFCGTHTGRINIVINRINIESI